MGQTQQTNRRSVILDGGHKPLKDDYYALLSTSKRIQIFDSTRNDLPKHLNNRDIITEIKTDDDTSQGIKVENIEKIQEFYTLIDSLRSKPVILTVSRIESGGYQSKKPRYVRVRLQQPPQPQKPLGTRVPLRGRVGGKKTTYRRKKHVTRRKINTKKRKVMVGGTVIHNLEDWKLLPLNGKITLIESVETFKELKKLNEYNEKMRNDEQYKLEQYFNVFIALKKKMVNFFVKKRVICDCTKKKNVEENTPEEVLSEQL
jgi:hypothetical protein